MNRDEAKSLLLLNRPWSAEPPDPATAEALRMAEQDPELRLWFESHQALQQETRARLRSLPVPPNLRDRIVQGRKIIPLWRRRTAVGAMAAGIVLLLSLVLWPRSKSSSDLAAYRARMVRTVLREYRMDIVTNDLAAVRAYLQTNGAPAEYQIPSELARIEGMGGGILKWKGNPVSMVCFDRGGKQPIWLLVLERQALKEPPSAQPEFVQVNKLMTASWSDDRYAYLLGAQLSRREVEKIMNYEL